MIQKPTIDTRATAGNVYDSALSLDTQMTYDEDFNHYVNLDYGGLKAWGKKCYNMMVLEAFLIASTPLNKISTPYFPYFCCVLFH